MTTLASQSCGKLCNEDADFSITFHIHCLTLANEEKFSEDEKFLSITWDNNVVRTMAKESLEEFKRRPQVLLIHCTPVQLNQKLKSSPILMNLTAFCEDLGSVKFPLTDCFCDAVMCSDFNSQVLRNDFKFVRDEIEHGTIEIDLKIERLDGQPSVFDAIKKSQVEASKRRRRKPKTQSDSDADDEFDEALCRVDFPLLNELPAYCEKHFGVDEHSYRIINGHLVNVKDKRGFCGDVCKTAMKYCKEFKDLPASRGSSFNLQSLFNKKTENVQKIPSKVFEELSRMKFVNEKCKEPKSISECKIGKDKVEKKTKKKSKKAKVCKSKQSLESCNKERNEFISRMKLEATGKYSYEFGNSYPFHRSACSIPNVVEKVPSHMGWRHDKVILDSQPNKSWQPGRINSIVRTLMKHFLRPYPYDTLSVPKSQKKNAEKYENCKILRPTLQVGRHDNEILVQMRPLKDNDQLATDCNPYLNCSPLKFMIKRHPDEIKMHKARKLMKSRGFHKKCSCHDMKYCRCISSIRKEMFKDEMKKVSRELNMKNEIQYEDVHDSSDSEIDFEFTPPSVLDSWLQCKPDVAHTGTQYNFKDFLVTKKEKNRYFGSNVAAGCLRHLKL